MVENQVFIYDFYFVVYEIEESKVFVCIVSTRRVYFTVLDH